MLLKTLVIKVRSFNATKGSSHYCLIRDKNVLMSDTKFATKESIMRTGLLFDFCSIQWDQSSSVVYHVASQLGSWRSKIAS